MILSTVTLKNFSTFLCLTTALIILHPVWYLLSRASFSPAIFADQDIPGSHFVEDDKN
jgi:hypothetical protein